MYKLKGENLLLYGLILLVAGVLVSCPDGAKQEDLANEDLTKVESITYNGGNPIMLGITAPIDSSTGTPAILPEGATGTFAITAGSLPTGLVLNPTTGQITGTPTAGTTGETRVKIQFTANGSYTGSAETEVVITVPLSLTPVTSFSYNSNSPIMGYLGIKLDTDLGTPTITPDGATGKFTVKTGRLPQGLSLDRETGQISGTPTALHPDGLDATINFIGSGNYTGTVLYVVSIIIRESTPVSGLSYNKGNPGNPDNPIEAYVGTKIDENVTTPTIVPVGATGTFAIIGEGVLPEGLSLNENTGVIAGTPTSLTTEAVTVEIGFTANGEYSGSVTTTLSIAVVPVPDEKIPVSSIHYNKGEDIITLQSVEFNVDSTDPSGNPTLDPTGATGEFSLLEGQTLPGGLLLSSTTGAITGTPTAFNRSGTTVTINFVATGNYTGTVETNILIKTLRPVSPIAYNSNPWEITIPSSELSNTATITPTGATGTATFVTGEKFTDPTIIGGVTLAEDGSVWVNAIRVRRIGTFNLRIRFAGTGDYGGNAYTDLQLTIGQSGEIYSASWASDSNAFIGQLSTSFLILWERGDGGSFRITSLLPTNEEGGRYVAVEWGRTTDTIIAARSGAPGFDIWRVDDAGIWQLDGSFPNGEGNDNPYYGATDVQIEELALSPDETAIVSSEGFVATPGSVAKIMRVWKWNDSSKNFVLTQTLNRSGSDQVNDLVWAPDGNSFACQVNQKPVQFVWNADQQEFVESTPPLTQQVLDNIVISAWSPDLSSVGIVERGSDGGSILTIWNRGVDGSFTKGHSANLPHSSPIHLTFAPTTARIGYYVFNSGFFVVEWDESSDQPAWKSVGKLETTDVVRSWDWSPDGMIVVGSAGTSPPTFLNLK